MSLLVTGLGAAVGTPCDPVPFLRSRKLRKFMGAQDDLTVVAAGRALASAGLAGPGLADRAGLFLAVGYIPFDAEDIDRLHAGSHEEQRFSMRRFSTEAYEATNPLLTFRCLPNMPAFHVSVNFDVQGPYFVTYPGAGQLYLALEAACAALADGAIDVALVGGVAHQRNFLVSQHFARLEPPVPAEHLADGAGFLTLETEAHAAARAAPLCGRLLEVAIGYRPFSPFEEAIAPREWMDEAPGPAEELGPASLPVLLSRLGAGPHRHRVVTRDGIDASSAWALS
jgi:3-oxoacyl-(acyl-carrier-protein) synthase